jgi:hypothetical protein
MEKRNATPDDAKMIMKLYDLRREPVMRKARNFLNSFFPQSADEFLKIAQAWGSDENAYVRQVVSYWDMAASFVLQGALHEELFLESAGEMVFTFAKFHPFLAEIRKSMEAPEFLRNVETLLNRSEAGRSKLNTTLERIRKIGPMLQQQSEMRKQAAKS